MDFGGVDPEIRQILQILLMNYKSIADIWQSL
jgi:hypothetical protein